MFEIVKCLLNGHEWSPDDYEEEATNEEHEIGEEIFIRCHRCKNVMAGVEQMADGSLKWNAYDKSAIMYDLTPEYINSEGANHDIEKFREDNK